MDYVLTYRQWEGEGIGLPFSPVWYYHLPEYSDKYLGINYSAPFLFSEESVVKAHGECSTPDVIFASDGTVIQAQYPEAILAGLVSDAWEDLTVIFPESSRWVGDVSYVTKPYANKSNGTCGWGCSRVYALEKVVPADRPGIPIKVAPDEDADLEDSEDTYYFYDCNITVSSSANIISAENSAIAAQAIALCEFERGYKIGTHNSGDWFDWKERRLDGSDTSYEEFFVPFSSSQPWRQQGISTWMESHLSRWALGVIAAVTIEQRHAGIEIEVTGHAPIQVMYRQKDRDCIYMFYGCLCSLAVLLVVGHETNLWLVQKTTSIRTEFLTQEAQYAGRFGGRQTGNRGVRAGDARDD